MKLKYNMIINDVAGQKVAVAVGDDLTNFAGFVKMNENAAFVFELLREEITEEEIVEKVSEAYKCEIDDTLKSDIHSLILSLKKEGILENDE